MAYTWGVIRSALYSGSSGEPILLIAKAGSNGQEPFSRSVEWWNGGMNGVSSTSPPPLPDTKTTKFVGWLGKAQGKWLQNMKGNIWSNSRRKTRWFWKGNDPSYFKVKVKYNSNLARMDGEIDDIPPPRRTWLAGNIPTILSRCISY